MGAPRKQFCVKGHDTFVVGRRSKSYSCVTCANNRKRQWYFTQDGKGKARNSMRIKELAKYGLTTETLGAVFDRQRGLCLGCNKQLRIGPARGERFHIDHDHKTGKFRGLLCPSCNTVLGLVQERPSTLRKLMAYLDYDRTKVNVYLTGALKNPRIPIIGNTLRQAGYDVMDEWFTPGEFADTNWQMYEKLRGRSYAEALNGRAATNIFLFDKSYLDLADAVVLVAPAGKSAMLELGYAAGRGQHTYIFLDGQEPDRYDVMSRMADLVVTTTDELIAALPKM